MRATSTSTLARNGGREPYRAAAFAAWQFELLPQQAYEVRYTPDQHIIGFAFDEQAGEHRYASDRVRRFLAEPNSLAYIPPGCDLYSRSPRGGEYLTARFRCAQTDFGVSTGKLHNIIDPGAVRAAHAIRRLLMTSTAPDGLLLEQLAAVLSAAVARSTAQNAPRSTVAASMTRRRLDAIDEHIEARLDTPLSVADLASSIGLSSGHFSRAFHAARGKSPHDYIIDRRLKRAREMMCEDAYSLSEIAHASGFTSHAHMSTLFKQRLGVSPSHLRATSAHSARRRFPQSMCTAVADRGDCREIT